MKKLVNERGEDFLKLKIFLDAKKIFIRTFIFNHTNIDETLLHDVLGENANKLSDEKSA